MTNRIINALEVIDIDHDQTHVPLHFFAVHKVAPQLLSKTSPVRKVRQVIEIGEVT
jgi:hypothetical protein